MANKVDLKEAMTQLFSKVLNEKKIRIKKEDDPSYGIDESLEEAPPVPFRKLPTRVSGKPGQGTTATYRTQQVSMEELEDALGTVPVKDLVSNGKLDFDKIAGLMGLGVDSTAFEARYHMDDLSHGLDESITTTGMGQKHPSQFQSMPNDRPEGQSVQDRMKNVFSKMGRTRGKIGAKQRGTDPRHISFKDAFDPVSNRDPASPDMGCGCDHREEEEDSPLSLMTIALGEGTPSDKAEEFIQKNKTAFKKRYGPSWKEKLYATANKQFPKD